MNEAARQTFDHNRRSVLLTTHQGGVDHSAPHPGEHTSIIREPTS
jgi:hypothetical protein